MCLANVWRKIWKSQGGRCFDCAKPMNLEDSCKPYNSFRIVCEECFEIRGRINTYIIIDDREGDLASDNPK